MKGIEEISVVQTNVGSWKIVIKEFDGRFYTFTNHRYFDTKEKALRYLSKIFERGLNDV